MELSGVGEDVREFRFGVLAAGSFVADDLVGVFELSAEVGGGHGDTHELQLCFNEGWEMLLDVVKELAVVPIRG